jgi:hypothetical protein
MRVNCYTDLTPESLSGLLLFSVIPSFHMYVSYMPVILVTQQAEIRRIMVQGYPEQNESDTLSQKYPT